MRSWRSLFLLLVASAPPGCASSGVPEPSGTPVTEMQADALRRQVKLTTEARALRVSDILSEAEGRMRYALSNRVLLDTTQAQVTPMSRMCSLTTLPRE